MKRCLTFALAAGLLSSCGYHLGGVKPAAMQDMNTFCVEMFDNETVVPNVAVQMTTALTDAVQRDGTYTLAPRDKADFRITGTVYHVVRNSLSNDYFDAYRSLELAVNVQVKYAVTDNRTGKVVTQSSVSGQGTHFNDEGNVQSSMDSALSYATRRAAEAIVNNIANR